MRARVASVVFNSVLRDARVLKQAESLKKNDFEINVFGIQDNNNKVRNPETSYGFDVILCDWRQNRKKLFSTKNIISLILFLLFGLAFFKLFGAPLHYIVPVSIFFVVIIFCMRFVKRIIKRKNILQNVLQFLGKRSCLFSQIYDCLLLFRRVLLCRIWEKCLVKEILEFKPDVVHCHDLLTVPVGLAVKKITGAKVVYDSHEVFTKLSCSTPVWEWWFRRVEEKISHKIDGFITVNRSISAYLKNEYPALPEPVLVRNATKIIEGDLSYDGRLHEAAGISPDQKILLYQGGYAPHRGLVQLVKAGGLLPEEWTLVFMGWGKLEDELRQIAAQVDPEGGRIKFVPPAPQAELVLWSAGATLGVIPYENVSLNHWYCTPNKLWEYPAAGVPILCSPFPELAAVIDAFGVGCLLNDPVTPEAIAEAVASLTEDDLQKKIESCKQFIQKDNWGVYEQNLFGLYGALV